MAVARGIRYENPALLGDLNQKMAHLFQQVSRVFVGTTMATKNATRQKSTAVREPRLFVGRDGRGFDHHYITTHETVVVIDTDTGLPVRRRELDDISIEEWVVVIGNRDGWTEQNLYNSFADQFAAQVEVR